jgi:small-conductance mechanosensitive channel
MPGKHPLSTEAFEGHSGRSTTPRSEDTMIILGIILLVIGFVTGISILWTIGIILVAIGALLWVLGAMGRAVGGRRHYW